ncbi:MAG: Asp-tRNA(Asn)/Glu-tRNA(Gln) amidotransferase subunit GatC [Longimicrobiales bacterium]
MPVTREDVLHMATLARLVLTTEEVERFTPQLGIILDHVAELEAASELQRIARPAADEPGTDAADATLAVNEPGAEPQEHHAPLAADEPGADPLHLAAAELAPAWRDGFFTVPRLAAMQGTDDAESGDAS